jgi:uncharacterized membrane protein
LNLKDPEAMNEVIGNVLRAGVVASAAVILIGTILLVATSGFSGTSMALTYNPNQIPHGTFDVSIAGLVKGLIGFQPYSIIELGVIILLATPVSRVLISVLLFAAEGDRLYVYITAVVLALLLFSMLVTPFIPAFNA